jgi:hypothetical protein
MGRLPNALAGAALLLVVAAAAAADCPPGSWDSGGGTCVPCKIGCVCPEGSVEPCPLPVPWAQAGGDPQLTGRSNYLGPVSATPYVGNLMYRYASPIVAGPVLVNHVDPYGSVLAIVVRQDRVTAHNLSDLDSVDAAWTIFNVNYTGAPVVTTTGDIALPASCPNGQGVGVNVYSAATGEFISGPPQCGGLIPGGNFPLLGTDAGVLLAFTPQQGNIVPVNFTGVFQFPMTTAIPSTQPSINLNAGVSGPATTPAACGPEGMYFANGLAGAGNFPTGGSVSLLPVPFQAEDNPQTYLGPFSPFISNPVLDVNRGLLFAIADYAIFAFDATSPPPGTVVWSNYTGLGPIFGSRSYTMALTQSGILVVAASRGGACGYAPPEGGSGPYVQVWCNGTGDSSMTVVPLIVGADGTVYSIGTGTNGPMWNTLFSVNPLTFEANFISNVYVSSAMGMAITPLGQLVIVNGGGTSLTIIADSPSLVPGGGARRNEEL